MNPNLEKEMETYLRPLFGDMAPITIASQKEKLGLGPNIEQKDYIRVAEEIKKLCNDMAGDAIANKIYKGLVAVIEKP